MKIDDETLSAYIDGELEPEKHRAVEAALAGSPELVRRVALLTTADRQTRALLHDIDDQPMPDALNRLLEPSGDDTATGRDDGNVVVFRSRSGRGLAATRRGMALAASLALLVGFGAGLMTGDLREGRPRTAALAPAAGVIAPAHPLYDVLQSAASGKRQILEGGNAATVLLSFRSKPGAYCRDVSVDAGAAASRGVYCRTGEGAWTIRVLAASAPNAPGYAPAAGEGPAIVEQSIDKLIAGAPLGPAAEARAIETGWTAK